MDKIIAILSSAVEPITGEIKIGGRSETYQGSYEITPTGEVQVLDTSDKMMIDNLVVNAVPSNYGLITWNGSYLIVS